MNGRPLSENEISALRSILPAAQVRTPGTGMYRRDTESQQQNKFDRFVFELTLLLTEHDWACPPSPPETVAFRRDYPNKLKGAVAALVEWLKQPTLDLYIAIMEKTDPPEWPTDLRDLPADGFVSPPLFKRWLNRLLADLETLTEAAERARLMALATARRPATTKTAVHLAWLVAVLIDECCGPETATGTKNGIFDQALQVILPAAGLKCPKDARRLMAQAIEHKRAGAVSSTES